MVSKLVFVFSDAGRSSLASPWSGDEWDAMDHERETLMVRRLLYGFLGTAEINLFAALDYPKTAYRIIQDPIRQIAKDNLRAMQLMLETCLSEEPRDIVYLSAPLEANIATVQDVAKSLYPQKERLDFTSVMQRFCSSEIPTVLDPLKQTALVEGIALCIIQSRTTQLMLINGWEKSESSSKAYLAAVIMQMGFTTRQNINIVDQQGDPLSLDTGVRLLVNACADCEKRGVSFTALEEVIAALLEAEEQHRTSPKKTNSLLAYSKELIDEVRIFYADLQSKRSARRDHL